MRRLEPVIWTKGTFLNPQHLQSQDRFLEETLQFDLQALEFRPWGFGHLRLDHAALAAGNLVVSEAAGIFPDGLLFDIPESDAAPPAKPLADHFQADVEAVDVYLAIPSYRERGFNVASARRDAETRYRAEVEMVRDENTGQSEKPIMVARKNLRLAADTENREGSSTLQVARVRKTAAGLFQLDPRFVPPLLDFEASDYLVSIARRLVEILSAKSTELAGARRQKNQTLADFTSADIPRFWLLYTVNAALPVFRHLFETRKGHPEALYAAMLSLAGSLSTFSVKIHPRDLPPYDHDNLGACFTDLDEKLRFLLETVVPSNCISLPLKRVQPSIYATSIDNEKYLQQTRMYLAVSADMSQADLIAKTPQLVKICSVDAVEHLVQRALPGVALMHVLTPPSAIPIKLNYQYFGLNQGGGSWEAVVRARNLAAYVPGDFPNPQMELVIVLPQAG
ncbi:MAG TPA: type VI secretion system baseplate subunit TssK [Bryobacteraceae bacterium]|nr:type VI secretion system baseplate subunit TssK [Bryobacteraceae bacterium]